MADIKLLDPNSIDDDHDHGDDDGERGKRGKRGHRGHDGPTGSTGPTGPAGSSTGNAPVIAVASIVGADGSATTNTGFSSTTRVSTGLYHLTLANPPPDGSVVPVITVRTSSPPAIAFALVSGGVISVFTATAASGFTLGGDTDFFIIVSEGS